MRIASNYGYIHNNRSFTFSGTKLKQFVTAIDSIEFYQLILSKSKDSSLVKFNPTSDGNSYNIQVVNQLSFPLGNKAHIDLSNTKTPQGYPDYNKGEWFITMGTTATVQRSGLGHIDGELRKFIPTDGLSGEGIVFEVGGGIYYRKFMLDLTPVEKNNKGIAGYIGVQSLDNLHPEAPQLEDPINFNYPNERLIQNYWRLTRPSTSAFAQQSRNMDLTVGYANPQDIPPSALIYASIWYFGRVLR